ncbi:MAG: hypothetical protein AB1758_35750, partial [Candidatus Eremiobacterota bacterium]
PTGHGLGAPTNIQGGQVHYVGLPTFDAITSWPQASAIVKARLVGDAGKQAWFHFTDTDPHLNHDGRANERTTVWWALQMNDRLRFDVDTNNFFMTYPDGSTRNVANLQSLMSVRQAGGWNGPPAYHALASHVQMMMTMTDLITPPYQPGATAVTPQPFTNQWDLVFPRPDASHLYGFGAINLPPSTTIFPPSGFG